MDDKENKAENTQVNDQTAPVAAAVASVPKPSAEKPKKRGGWFRRLFFVFLMLVVVVGLVVSAVLLRLRLDAVLSQVDSLNAQLKDTQSELGLTQSDLAQTQTDLANTQQALESLATASADARAQLAEQMHYYLLLQQAQGETSKAILSITQDDLGQARREITALRASLVAATALGTTEDIAVLADLESRAGQAEADLNANSFASQQTLEVIWRDLDGLSATALSNP